jgi:hypothetical protein
MAESWLELQNNLSTGASRLALPKPNVGCGLTFTTNSPSSVLNLPSPSESFQSVNDALGLVQDTIDQFGSDVMSVLQDIGAFIPPGSSSGSITSEDNSTTVDTDQPSTADHHETTTSAGGNIAITEGYDSQTGDSFWQLRTSSGSGITFDTNGGVYINTSKNPDEDADTGNFAVTSNGMTTFKCREGVLWEVANDNKIRSAGFTLLLHNGSLEIVVNTGDIKIKGNDNIVIEAGKSLELKGSDVKIHAGTGTGTPAKDGKPVADEQAGVVEIKAGVFKNSSVTQQNIEGASFHKVSGEKSIIMDDSQAAFTIDSRGSLELKCKGDMVETIGGRKLTKVLTYSPADLALDGGIPPLSIIRNQSSGYYITNSQPIVPAGSAETDLPGTLLQVVGGGPSGAGIKVDGGIKGNIILTSQTGNIAFATENSIYADMTQPSTSALDPKLMKGLKPGLYFGAATKSVLMYSDTEVAMGLTTGTGPPRTPFTDNAVSVSVKGTYITDRTRGIYLN